jgi:hypothetical protein
MENIMVHNSHKDIEKIELDTKNSNLTYSLIDFGLSK